MLLTNQHSIRDDPVSTAAAAATDWSSSRSWRCYCRVPPPHHVALIARSRSRLALVAALIVSSLLEGSDRTADR
jgi:hypothetical protein